MNDVLVTGGTGTLGRVLVPHLVEAGHNVLVLSRRPPREPAEGAEFVLGDVRSHERVREAAVNVDTVIHLATSPRWRPRSIEKRGVQNAIAVARERQAHLIYMSIVGTDKIRFPYYKAKWVGEQHVEASDVAWTIQRATQFHSGMEEFLSYGVWPTTPNMAFQPVDTGEMSERLLELVLAGPSRRTPDFGGPEILPIRELLAIRRSITGKRVLALRGPRVSFLRDLDGGHQLPPGCVRGHVTWSQWLTSQVATPVA